MKIPRNRFFVSSVDPQVRQPIGCYLEELLGNAKPRRPESRLALFLQYWFSRLRHLRFTQARGLLNMDSVGDRGVFAVSAQPSQHSDLSCQRQTRSFGFFDA